MQRDEILTANGTDKETPARRDPSWIVTTSIRPLSTPEPALPTQRTPARWQAALLLGFLSVVYAVPTCIRAAREKLWFDEILSVYTASLLPSLHAFFSFLSRGMELNPPLGYLPVALSQHVFGRTELAARIPSIAAFWIMALCLYLFLRRRLPFPYAIAGMLFPFLTPAQAYSFEARAYALVLGFAGVALVAWQAAADGRRRAIALPLIALSLTCAILSHPMAVTLALPFLAGEVHRTLRRKRLDRAMWFAFAAALPALLVLWRIRSVDDPRKYTPGPADPLLSILSTYVQMLGPAIFTLLAAWLVMLVVRRDRPVSSAKRRGMRDHEISALIGFALIPFAAVALAGLGGPYWLRYSLNSVIGLAGLVSVLLFRAGVRRRRAGPALLAVFVASFVIVQVLPETMRLDRGLKLVNSSGPVAPYLDRIADRNSGPIVIQSPLTFLELEYYSTPKLANRLYYLTDPDGKIWSAGNNQFEVKGPSLAEFFPLRAHFQDYHAFLATHQNFLWSAPSGASCATWRRIVSPCI